MDMKVVEALQAAEFTDKQALAIAAAIPDLEPLRMEMNRMEGRLIKWMVGTFLTFTTLLRALLTSVNLLQG